MPDPLISLLLAAPEPEVERAVMCQTLRQAGFAVRTAATAAETLRLAADHTEIVLLAQHLGGLDLYRRLRSDPATACVSVVLLTDDDSVRDEADAVLIRPVRPAELVSTVRTVLRLRRTAELRVADRTSPSPEAPSSAAPTITDAGVVQ